MRALALASLLVSIVVPVVAWGGIEAASFERPVSRYHHNILGDTPEWEGLRLRLNDGTAVTIVLPETHIFEDIAPRLADLDGDGDTEVVVVQSSLTQGARLTVWDETGMIAATPYIGRPNRWLAPIGIADLDGDGKIEIAYIDRPHLAKLLRIWRFDGGKLALVAEQDGLTNHRIGEAFFTGGVRDCGTGPEMVTVNGDWSRVIISTLDAGRVTVRDGGAYRGAASVTAALGCR